MADFPIADAHHHFWNPERNYHPWLRDDPMIPFRYGDYSSLRRPFMPEDYVKAALPYTVEKSVAVEGEWDPTDPVGETRWINGVAREYGRPSAFVAQIWLDHEDVEEVMTQQASFPLVRSVRHKPRSAPSPDEVEPGAKGSMGDKSFRHGFSLLSQFGLRFDLQTPWWHLAEAVSLAEKYPDTTIILNHTGLPSDRSKEGLAGWRDAMRLLARVPHAYVKISGLGIPGRPWLAEDNRPIIQDTIELFGVERCMFASNFPVDSLVAGFQTIFDGFRAAVSELPTDDQRKLFYHNAVRVYRIEE